MDLLKQVVADSVLDKIRTGEWAVESISEQDGGVMITIQTETKQGAVEAATPVEKQKRKLHRSPEARAELRTRIYDILSPIEPMSLKQIGEQVHLGTKAVLVALREMPEYVEETTGNKTKCFKFVKKPLAIPPQGPIA